MSTTEGVVATDDPIASRIGAEALAAGGNAIDAAAASAFALGVVNPTSSGIGGGGFAVVYVANERKLYAIDFRETAPAALRPASFERDGTLDPSLSRTGGLAVGVPGEVAGLEHLVTRLGRRSFRSAVQPAQELAARGFPASWFLSRGAVLMTPIVELGTPLRALLFPAGLPLAEGAMVRRPELADTLAAIGRRGSAGFYRGPVAADIIETVQRGGGVMTAEDLASYRVVEREPLVGTWRGLRIATMPLPSSGGIVLLEALGILDATGIDLGSLGAGSSGYLHLIAEVLKHTFADRARFLGDADPARLAEGPLLDPARLAAVARRIDPTRVAPHESYGDRRLGKAAGAPARGDGTSHLCVIDAEGNAVALTTTVNGYFGAKLRTPKSDVVLNNQIDDFALAAGVPNMFGLVQSEFNLVAPGKRPLSSMSPTLVLDGDRVVGCLGGSGGPRIISNTLQVLLSHFALGMDAAEAVNTPRLHHQWMPDELVLEAEISPDTVEALRRRGHKLRISSWRTSPSAVQAIFVDASGVREAASDPRKRGQPAVSASERVGAPSGLAAAR
ncbi:MAG TPA: gamma-glutamyltransferase [Kofleriaceae bacterium]|nr:gamma-glutamyltransferase [Kofleriaceae bacterium]